MTRGIIIEHTLVDTFDGSDIHKKDTLTPNTEVKVLGHSIVYGIDYAKIQYGDKIGYVDAVCVVEIKDQ